MSSTNSRFGGLSKGSSWLERRQNRDQDCWYEEHKERPNSGDGSSQLYQSAFYIPKQEHYDRRDQELEHLRKQVFGNIRESRGELSHQIGSH